MRVAFCKENDAGALQKFLETLPEGTKLINIYAQGSSHIAWYLVPETNESQNVTIQKSNKGRK